MKNEIDREPIKEAIAAYQETHKRSDFVSKVGNKVYLADQLWEIIDQLFDLGEITKIDFKDLY